MKSQLEIDREIRQAKSPQKPPKKSAIFDADFTVKDFMDYTHAYLEHQRIEHGNPRVVCAWCGAILDDRGAIAAGDRVSHGICEACKEKELRKIS